MSRNTRKHVENQIVCAIKLNYQPQYSLGLIVNFIDKGILKSASYNLIFKRIHNIKHIFFGLIIDIMLTQNIHNIINCT